jgi:prolyl oligopeptidase
MQMSKTLRAAALLAALAAWQGAHALDYPDAPKKPVTNTYWGVQVNDDYQWLENAADPATKAWVAAENKLSRQWLDSVPGRDALHAQIDKLVKSTSNSYYDLVERGGVIFALKFEPPKQQPLLVTLKSVDATSGEHVVIDPNAMSSKGSIAIDFYAPSPDGKKVAVSLSENGSEDGSLHVFDAATGKEQGDVVPRAAYPTGGGSVAWNQDASGFYYTRYPAPGERAEADMHFYQQVWFHKLGTPAAKDRYAVGKDFPRIAETVLETTRDGRNVAALVSNGDGGDHSLYLKTAKGGWQRIAGYDAEVKAIEFGDDGWLYLLSRKNAPKGQILRVSLAHPDVAKAELVMPEGEGTIQAMRVALGKVYASELVGGPSKLQAVDLKTREISDIALPPVSAVNGLVRGEHDEILADIASYVTPPAWYHVQPGHEPRKTALVVTSAANYDDAEVKREFAVSKDGTKIPLNIIMRKGTKLDGSNPTILYGYGGYGVSMTPYFSSIRRIWLDHGGIYVVANIRGGGEYGEAWHTAGNLTHKQNVFDDFIASAEYLIAQHYTSTPHLAIMGGSNGGLLMGAVLTQRPDLFRAVSSSVGIYDMLRVELDPNGAFNTTEFGTVKDKAQFEALHAYSPYHHVKDGTDYPAVLMMTGDNDGRVNPAHSRKMIARLQAADPHGKPILLRTTAAAGHGIGTALDEVINEQTDNYAFLFHELGVDLTAH